MAPWGPEREYVAGTGGGLKAGEARWHLGDAGEASVRGLPEECGQE